MLSLRSLSVHLLCSLRSVGVSWLFSDLNGRYFHVRVRCDADRLLITRRLVLPAETREIISLLDSLWHTVHIRITLRLILISEMGYFLRLSSDLNRNIVR